MSTTISSQPAVLPELAYGSVWLVGAGDGGGGTLSPIAAHALGTADAVIHDPAVPQTLLDLVRPPRYREAALPHRGIERSIKLARDGWRVVHLVEGNAIERIAENAHRFAEQNVPLRIVPTIDDVSIGDAPAGFLLVRKTRSAGQTALIVVLGGWQPEAAAAGERQQPPTSFSMSGIAG